MLRNSRLAILALTVSLLLTPAFSAVASTTEPPIDPIAVTQASQLEAVFVLKVMDSDYKTLVARADGSTWLMEYGIGCLGLWRFESKIVYVTSPYSFGGVGSRIVLPNDGGSCRIWDASQIEAPRSSTRSSTPPPTDTTSLTIWDINGVADLIADDGQYLGVISNNRYDADSICNKYATYGNKYSSESVRNKYGSYGSAYSDQSAYNKYTSNPPRIIFQNRVVGYLTKNATMSNGVDPDVLFATYGCADD